MEAILRRIDGHRVPSKSGRAVYLVTVQPGNSVTLVGPRRRYPSVLLWADIRHIYTTSRRMQPEWLNTVRVDEILENPNNRDSSTMCALVLAMMNLERVRP
jgi:hypothetical protein